MDYEDPTGLKNGFTDMPVVSIESLAQNERVQPRNVPTGVTRGTWRMNNTDGSYILIGLQPGGGFGIGFYDASNSLVRTDTASDTTYYDSTGNILKRITAETDFYYDPSTNKNYFQVGKLPNDVGGVAGANTGYDVEDGF